MMLQFIVFIISITLVLIKCDINEDLTNILERGINEKTYPGAVAIVGHATKGILYNGAVGHYTYDTDSPAMNYASTYFDLASVSKVLGTTTAIALLYQSGFINLDMKISDVLDSDFGVNNKQDITIKLCLLHEAGFQPDPSPQFWDKKFQCPQNTVLNPDGTIENFDCLDQIYDSIMNQSLIYEPGSEFLYSDISFMTLQLVVGKVVLDNDLIQGDQLLSQCSGSSSGGGSGVSKAIDYVCHFEAYLRTYVFTSPELLQYSNSNSNDDSNDDTEIIRYLLKESEYSQAAPTILDVRLQKSRAQGQVSDGNCYSAGGICGHAGLFSTGNGVSNLLRYLVAAPPPTTSTLQQMLNSDTIKLFSTINNASFSSRALGWDTNSYNTLVTDAGFDNSCSTLFPENTFMHIGYTGTCVCAVQNSIYSVILTNRVYNCIGLSCSNTSISTAVKEIYREFNSLAYQTFIGDSSD